MAAQRCGTSVLSYTASRTMTDLQRDTQAWMATWSYPARVLLSAIDGSTREGGSSNRMPAARPDQPGSGLPSWYKRKPGVSYTAHDLGPTVGQSTDGRGTAADWNVASSALRSQFSLASRLAGRG